MLRCRLYPSAGDPRRGSDLQRLWPQLYWSYKLPHLQRPAMPGQFNLSVAWMHLQYLHIIQFIYLGLGYSGVHQVFSLPSNTFRLLLQDPKVVPGQIGHIIPYSEDLQREASRSRPEHMPAPHWLTHLDFELTHLITRSWHTSSWPL